MVVCNSYLLMSVLLRCMRARIVKLKISHQDTIIAIMLLTLFNLSRIHLSCSFRRLDWTHTATVMTSANTDNDNIFSPMNGGVVVNNEPSIAPSMTATTKEPSIALGGMWGDETGNYDWVDKPVYQHGHNPDRTFERNTFPPFTLPPASDCTKTDCDEYIVALLFLILVVLIMK